MLNSRRTAHGAPIGILVWNGSIGVSRRTPHRPHPGGNLEDNWVQAVEDCGPPNAGSGEQPGERNLLRLKFFNLNENHCSPHWKRAPLCRKVSVGVSWECLAKRCYCRIVNTGESALRESVLRFSLLCLDGRELDRPRETQLEHFALVVISYRVIILFLISRTIAAYGVARKCRHFSAYLKFFTFSPIHSNVKVTAHF